MHHSFFIHSSSDGHLVYFHFAVLIVVQSLSCIQLCNPIDCNRPGFPVLHYPPEFAQTQVCGVGDAIQPSHLLSSPSPPTFNLSQHQGLFQWISSLHQVAKLLELQLQHQSFQWIFHFLAITHKANLNIRAPECAWTWFLVSWANWMPCLCHMVFIISGGKINLVYIIPSWPEAFLSAFQITCF